MVTYKTHEHSPDHKGFRAQYEAVCGGKLGFRAQYEAVCGGKLGFRAQYEAVCGGNRQCTNRWIYLH